MSGAFSRLRARLLRRDDKSDARADLILTTWTRGFDHDHVSVSALASKLHPRRRGVERVLGNPRDDWAHAHIRVTSWVCAASRDEVTVTVMPAASITNCAAVTTIECG